MHNAGEGSAWNELYLYLVHWYEYRGTICRSSPHRWCGRRKVYRGVDVGLSIPRGGVLRPRRELGQTRRPIGRERKKVRWGTWTDDNSRVGDRDWQYVRVFCEGTAIAQGAIHAGSTDGSALTRSDLIISGRGDTVRTYRIATTAGAGEYVSVSKGVSLLSLTCWYNEHLK